MKLKEAGLVNAAKVDRQHLNYMQVNQGAPFKYIDTDSDILEAFASNPLAYAQVSQYLGNWGPSQS